MVLFSCDLDLQARIAFLQGERKGQENLKKDLVRRIKMLEHALKQERAKYAKLKYGSESTAALVAAGALADSQVCSLQTTKENIHNRVGARNQILGA